MWQEHLAEKNKGIGRHPTAIISPWL